MEHTEVTAQDVSSSAQTVADLRTVVHWSKTLEVVQCSSPYIALGPFIKRFVSQFRETTGVRLHFPVRLENDPE